MPPLEEPVGHAVRHLALGYLDAAAAAAERLDADDDSEALHDFRVALRRLRSLIRAYHTHFHGSVPELIEARLRKLTRRTNPGRDHEVHLVWLQAQRASLPRGQRAALDWLCEWLAATVGESCKPARLRKRFARIDSALRDHLADRSEDDLLHDDPDGSFATAFQRVVEDAVNNLRKRSGKITSADATQALHRARIAGKRLRYALEPLRDELPAIAKPLQACKRMQDLLGAIQDMHTLSKLLALAVEQAAAERARRRLDAALAGDDKLHVPDYHAALVTLACRARDAQHAHYAAFEKEFLRGGLKRLIKAVEALPLTARETETA